MEGPWRHSNLDAGAAMIIPVPVPLGGAVVVGEASITYLSGAQPAKSVPLKATIVRVRRLPPGQGRVGCACCCLLLYKVPLKATIVRVRRLPPGHNSRCMEECMLLSTAASKRCLFPGQNS